MSIFLAGLSHGETGESDLFEKAYENYLANNPAKALELFDSFLSRYPNSSAADSIIFWRAKSLMQLKRNDDALKGFSLLKKRFPESSYAAFADKEIELINNNQPPVAGVRPDKPRDEALPSQAGSKIDDRVARLESEKHELASKLSEAEKKRQLTEKGLTKALEDRNLLEAQLDELRKEKDTKIAAAVKSEADIRQLEGENKALKHSLSESNAKAVALSDQLKQINEKSSVRSADMEKELREKTKAVENLEKEVASLKNANLLLDKSVKEKDEKLAALSGKAKKEVGTVEKELETEKTKRSLLNDENQKLQGMLKDSEEKLSSLSAKLNAESNKVAELQEASTRLKEALSKQDSINAQITKQSAERKELEKILSEQQSKISDLQTTINSIRSSSASADLAKDNKILELSSKNSALASEKGTIGAALETEKTRTATLSRKLADNESLLAARTRSLENAVAESEKCSSKQNDILELADSYRTKLGLYEKPFVKINGETFSIRYVLEDGFKFNNLAEKIKAGDLPWRGGNIVDDFIVEQIMLSKAKNEGILADASAADKLAVQYKLSDNEKSYLKKYIVLREIYKRRSSTPSVSDKDIREYYDRNRDKYKIFSERRVKLISIRHGEKDELEKSILAIEMRDEALKGMAFDDIIKDHSVFASAKEMPLSSLPDWIQQQIAGLKDGDVSDILSINGEMIIVIIMPTSHTYISFDKVKAEIEKRLYSEQLSKTQPVGEWLNSLRREAVFLR